GPNAYFPAALEMLYRSFSCADNGFERELYVANVGLVRRIVSTFAGPRTFELVHARVGPLTVLGEPGAAFHVSLDRTMVELKNGESQRLRVTMRLSVYRSPELALQFPSS